MATATAGKNGTLRRATAIGGESPTNGGAEAIEAGVPYTATVTIRGVADFLFHRWNNEAVAAKAAAVKGSKAKKTDDIESYVYRNGDGVLCIPGEYLIGSITNRQKGAARNRQDPRSPRKSAVDLFQAGVVSLTQLAPLGTKAWDYEDHRRVIIQGSAVTRVRPAMKAGWEATFDLMVTLPEYISRDLLHAVLIDAGRFVGVGDFRPSFGRFQVTSFSIRD